jgi:hypothetical protein
MSGQDRHQLVFRVFPSNQRQLVHRRSRLLDRRDVHEENRSCLVTEPELLDLVIEIVPESGWNLLRQDLLSKLGRGDVRRGES